MSKTPKPGMLTEAELRQFAEPVWAAQNLHFLPAVMWSVYRARPRKLIAYTAVLVLRDVRFVIKPGEQRRARFEHQRNLHAFAEGLVASERPPEGAWLTGRYNVHKWDTFVDADTERPITEARWVRLDRTGMHYLP